MFCSILDGQFFFFSTDLPSMHTMLLLELPAMDTQNALSTVMVFHTALLLIKDLIPEQKKCGSVPVLMEFTGPTMFPTILKQLA